MRKLSKDDINSKETLAKQLDEAKAGLEVAVETYNKEVSLLFDTLKLSVDRYNEAREAVNSFVEDIVRGVDEYIDQRSDTWQETDAATYMAAFKDQWDEEIDELELDEPEDLEVDNDTVVGGEFLRDKSDEPDS